MIPDRPNFGTGLGGGSATEERLQDEWDAKYAPDLKTARRTIDELLEERARTQPVYEAAVARHRAYFGPTAHRAAKCKATMDLNKATDRAMNS